MIPWLAPPRLGRLQRSCRARRRNPWTHADRRREGGRDDVRPPRCPSLRSQAPTGAQRVGLVQLPGGGTSAAATPGARAPPAVSRLVGQIAGVERLTRSDGRLLKELQQKEAASDTSAWIPHSSSSRTSSRSSPLESSTLRSSSSSTFHEAGHVRNWFAPFRVRGDGVRRSTCASGATTSSSRDRRRNRVLVSGTYLEVEPPTRTVATWLFEGWRMRTPSSPWICRRTE